VRANRRASQGSRSAIAREWTGRNAKSASNGARKVAPGGAAARIESAWIGHELNAVLPEGAIVVERP